MTPLPTIGRALARRDAFISSSRARRALVLVGVLAVCGCASPSTTSPPSTTPSTTTTISTAGVLPAPATLRVGAADVDQLEAELATISRNALEQFLVDSGVEEVLPGIFAEVVALDGEITADGRSFTSELLDLPGELPVRAGFGRSQPMVSTRSTELAVMGTGLLSSIIDQSLDHATTGSTSLSERPDDPSEPHITVDGGDIDVRYTDSKTAQVDGATVTVDMELAGVLGACPTATGTVSGELSVAMTLEVIGATGSTGATYTMMLDIDGQVDDQAHLVGHEMTVSGSASGNERSEHNSSNEVEGFFIEGGSSTSFTGNAAAGDFAIASVGGQGVTRTSSAVTGDMAQSFIDSQHSLATSLSSLVLHRAEAFWRSGACIDVELDPSADPQQLDPFQTIDLSVNAISSDDGASIEGSVGASVAAGSGSVSPSASPTLPASFSLTASDDASPSTVEIEVRSRRGIGRASVELAGVQGYIVDGVLDVFHAGGVKCGGAAGAWELDLTASFQGAAFTGSLTFELDPPSLTGRFLLTGTTSGVGITVDQQGTGDVSFVEDADGTARLVFDGVAWAGGPSETHSISLRPTEACR